MTRITMELVEAGPAASARVTAWRVARRVAPAIVALATLLYWQRTGERMAIEHPEAMNMLGTPAVAGAWLAFGQLLGNVLEAALYVSWWRLTGARLAWLPLTAGIFAASAFEAGAWQAALAARASHLSHVSDDGAWRAWLAILAGSRALWDDAAGVGGLGVAFGGAGLLAALRIAATAEAQSRAGVPRRHTYLVTFAAWLAFRLIAGFGLDLLRGFSPLGG